MVPQHYRFVLEKAKLIGNSKQGSSKKMKIKGFFNGYVLNILYIYIYIYINIYIYIYMSWPTIVEGKLKLSFQGLEEGTTPFPRLLHLPLINTEY